jgi:arylsulfatase A-like enzyme
MTRLPATILFVASAFCVSVAAQPSHQHSQAVLHQPAPPPNIVLIVADDMGVDLLSVYGEGTNTPCTPTIDGLAASGLVFRNAWGYPICAPARAAILTGRHGFRSGIGRNPGIEGNVKGLAQGSLIIPKALEGYESSAVGKWHLTTGSNAIHPNRLGFGYYAGCLFNVLDDGQDSGTYFSWIKTVNGEQFREFRYATTDTATDAIKRASEMGPPWFLYVALQAPHLPAHVPPEDTCSPSGACELQFCPPAPEAGTRRLVKSMVEAMDSEIGRMLDEIYRIDPGVVVIFVGDNGTHGDVIQPPFNSEHSKGTLYEGGINVPLIISAPGSVTGESDALVSVVDLFATITELAGQISPTEDSVSMVPYLTGMQSESLRLTVYSERFSPNFDPAFEGFTPSLHRRAVRNSRFKLIRLTDQNGATTNQLYDLLNDPFEAADLFPPAPGIEQENYDALVAALAELGVD